MTIRVAKAGLSTTMQDLGRFGYAHIGISPCGAADGISFRIANLLVGNDENAPALEMTLQGPILQFERGTIVAISGASIDCKLGQYRVATHTPLNVPAGGVLQCGMTMGGARAYLAVQGGFDVPLIMGSASTDLRGKFGGFSGRRLQAGDRLKIGKAGGLRERRLAPNALKDLRGQGPIRVTPGAQRDWFTSESFQEFVSSPFVVSLQTDRAGLRLQGKPLVASDRRQLITDGIPLGAIQVPEDGQTIILFVDQQTTGGYPKIASVIAADMYRIGQLRPGDEVRFAEVSISEAVDALRAQERWFRKIWRD